MLGFFLLALHHDAGGQMGDAHGTAGFVDMLAAGAAGPEDVDPQVLFVDLDHDFVVEFGIDEHRGKRGVALAAGVERRDAHQSVNAGLRLEIAVGVVARHGEGSALDAGLVSRLEIDHFGLEPLPLHPAQVHAKQHLGPVLGFGAAGAGVDGDDGVVGIVAATEHHLQSHVFNAPVESLELLGHFPQSLLIGLLLGHLKQKGGLLDIGGQFLERLDGV